MKYCVIKNTSKVIDGSDNTSTIMIKNAQNAGFAENEVEILTEEEYQTRKDAEPIQPQLPTTEERLKATEQALLAMMEVM